MTDSDRVLGILVELRLTRGELFDKLIDFALNKEYGDVLDAYQEEIMYFELDNFRNMSDVNISTLLEIIDMLDTKIQFLMNVNGIDEEELAREELLYALEQESEEDWDDMDFTDDLDSFDDYGSSDEDWLDD